MDDPVSLSSLNSHFTCNLCKGYLIDATTIIECLHSFCKSCIVKYLEDENVCPECHLLIHQSHPLSYIMADRTMQDIVNKAVPDLVEKERERIKQFYDSQGLEIPESELKVINANFAPGKEGGDNSASPHNTKTTPNTKDKGAECNYHRDDTQVAVYLEEGTGLLPLKRPYLQCSIHTTIRTLQRYIANRIHGHMERSHLDIFCQMEMMGKDHTLEFVLRTRWRTKSLPLVLQYRQRDDLIV